MRLPLALRDLPVFFLTEQQDAWRRLLRVPDALKQAQNVRVGTTPHDVVYTSGSLRLLRYRRSTPARHAEPVLFCYALVNRPYILDLQDEKSVVRRYLERGFDVYLIDWGTPSPAESHVSLEDYVGTRLREVVDAIRRAHDEERVHLVGYCMGGTLATLYTALHPEGVASLTLLATPLDFAVRDSLLNVWTDREHFDVDAFIAAHGNCPAWFLQSCFLQMKPVQNLVEKNLALYEHLDDPAFVEGYLAMERWINDNVPVAGETFRQFVKYLYQENRLVRGNLFLGEVLVELRRVTCPVLLLTASADHLVPPASTEGVRPHLGSGDVTSMSVKAGHVGLVVSSKAHDHLWPEATQWLALRSTPARAGGPAGLTVEGFDALPSALSA